MDIKINKRYTALASFLILQSCKETKIDYFKKNPTDLTSTDFDFPQKKINIISFGAYHASTKTEYVELKLLQSLTKGGIIKYYFDYIKRILLMPYMNLI